MKPLSIGDLLLVTAVIAAHLAHFPLVVAHPQSIWVLPVTLTPTLINAWIHLRFRLRLLAASVCNYVVSIAWSFLYGWGYCVALNQRHGLNPTYDRKFDTISWAVDDTLDMAIFAILTSTLYFAVGYQVRARAWQLAPLRRSKREVIQNED